MILFGSCFLLIGVIAKGVPAPHAPSASGAMVQHEAIGIRLNTENSTGRPVYVTSPQALQLPVPNRVVSVHDSRATNWDYQTGYHWQYIDQELVDDMVARGVKALTGRANTVDAWNDLIPYQPGEEVVIKLNFNNAGCSGYNNQIDGYPEPVNAVIDGLTSIGVPPGNIWITDPSRVVPARFRERITNPDVQYYAAGDCGDPNSHAVGYVDPDSPHASVAQCPAGDKIRPSQVFVDAEHLINIPILKSHGPYITLALKNHYGSVIYRDNTLESMHAYFNQWGNTGGCDLETKNILADINNNPHIRDKTRLVIGDGLFGNPYVNWDSVERWDIFDNDDPNILFFSTDPVAISSVMMDYIVAERGNQDHEHLHAAASLGLGVHEHWDSFENKHYTAIDYRIIDLDALGVILYGEPAAEAIHLTWEATGALPVTCTWEITYDGLTGDQPSPITGIISPTRAYTLIGLTGNTWYTVTLNAVLDSTPLLTDTVFIYLYAPLPGVDISGPLTGNINTAYVFTATVSPPTTALPITYTWQAMGQSDVVTSRYALSHAITFTWNTTGTQAITVTATNAGSTVTDTAFIYIYAPPTGVDISGPLTGNINTAYVLTATVSPPGATLPITYSWQATGQSDVVTSTYALSHAITFTWNTTGIQAITVTATNPGGTVSDTHMLAIEAKCLLYLPLIAVCWMVSRGRWPSKPHMQ